jgi:hypothetical protein
VANYVKSSDFAAKDALLTGNPAKIIKGTEIDTEFNNIATAISTKADTASPTFTGTPTAPTASNTTSTTQIATTAFVQTVANNLVNAAVAAADLGTISTQDANNVTITGGSITGITDILVSDGGTGVSSITANSVILGNGTSPIQVVAPGTSGNILTSDGTTWASAAAPKLTRGTVQSADPLSSSIVFTGIPSGVRQITVMLSSFSPNNGRLEIRLGTSSGIETTGYTSGVSSAGSSSYARSTSGFRLTDETIETAGAQLSGSIIFSNITGNIWVAHGVMDEPLVFEIPFWMSGRKELAGELTQLSLVSLAGAMDVQSAGRMNILYQ